MSMARDDFLSDEIAALLEMIYRFYSHDFRQYAPASIKRRIARAMLSLNLKSVCELHSYVLESRYRFDEFLRYLTVPVSAMFRAPTYFIALRQEVIPLLKTYASPRIWIAGCSTGEEVFSLAILLHEHGLLDRTVIYATDINTDALERAARGIFPLTHLQKYIKNYHESGGRYEFSNYYHADYDHFVIDRVLREKIIFSDHSLATDSAFAEMHFISCRNTLIYFDRDLQNKVIGMFHESLCRKGFLGLGSKETVEFSTRSGNFDTFVKTAKIFRKNDVPVSPY